MASAPASHLRTMIKEIERDWGGGHTGVGERRGKGGNDVNMVLMLKILKNEKLKKKPRGPKLSQQGC